MTLSGRIGLSAQAVSGDKLAAADVNQIVGHALAIGRVAAQRFGGEGLLSGGLFTTGSNWPPFAAVVYDDSGEAWWLGATGNTAMTFVDTSGACTAYLVVKQQTGVTPVAAIGGRGDFQVTVQLTASTAPAHSLALGAGNVTASAFTTWTEATGVRLNDWTVGSGADVDVTLYAENGDANRPALRYNASSNVWQFSHDGTNFYTIMAVGAAPTAHAASHNAGGSDALAIDAAAATGSLRTIGTGALQACAGNDSRLSDSRTPTSHASTHNAGGGDALAIDAAAATGSLRTLGTAATAACAGNDARLSDARTPTSHASSHNAGGGDALAIDAAAATGSLRTLGTSATSACAGNDARLSDARTPSAHKASHQNGGSDEIATATAGANAIPKAGSGGTLDKLWLPATIAVDTIDDRTSANGVQIKGRAGNTAIATGYLGEIVSSGDTNNWTLAITPAANSSVLRLAHRNGATASITLGAGIWMVTLQVAVWSGSGTSTNITHLGIGWNATNADTWTDRAELGNEGNNFIWMDAHPLNSNDGITSSNLTLPVLLSASTTLYPKTYTVYPASVTGTYQTRHRFVGVRIA